MNVGMNIGTNVDVNTNASANTATPDGGQSMGLVDLYIQCINTGPVRGMLAVYSSENSLASSGDASSGNASSGSSDNDYSAGDDRITITELSDIDAESDAISAEIPRVESLKELALTLEIQSKKLAKLWRSNEVALRIVTELQNSLAAKGLL